MNCLVSCGFDSNTYDLFVTRGDEVNAVCHAVPKTEIRIMSGCDSWQQSPVVMVAVFLDRHSRSPVGATTKQTDNISTVTNNPTQVEW